MKKPDHVLTWFEIPVADLSRAKSFYETIFDAEFTEMKIGDELKMALFPVTEGDIGGALCEHKQFYHPGQQGPIVYLNGNPDLQRILDRIPAAGGNIIIPKRPISEERGFMAIFTDSEGNRVGLQSRS